MIFSLIITERAKSELKEISSWYKERSQQAAKYFFVEFDETIEKVASHPFRYRASHKDYREIRMKKYPYYIVYRIDEYEKQLRCLPFTTHLATQKINSAILITNNNPFLR